MAPHRVRPSEPASSRPVGSGLLLVAAMAAVMWIEEVVDQVANAGWDRYGIRPRNADGLEGIVTAPFLHGGFDHLIGNTIPFLLLGGVIAFGGAVRVALVTGIVMLVGGLGTWLVAPANTVHIGASGVVFGYAAYLVARGVFGRSALQVLLGVAVLAVWGSTLLQGLVPEDGVSWQGHLFGALGGIAAARLLDARRAPSGPPVRARTAQTG